MEIKDLRIGNLIRPFNSDTFCIVKGIDSDNINVDYLNGERINLKISHKYFTGIPLTEEMLLKMGFAAIGTSGNTEYLSLDEWDIDFYEVEWHVNLAAQSLTQIEYIHQLMNLYHALTGQELTLS